ncbi:MAG: SdrD B-like domain-containing protein [Saprospiraceae bacterium]
MMSLFFSFGKKITKVNKVIFFTYCMLLFSSYINFAFTTNDDSHLREISKLGNFPPNVGQLLIDVNVNNTTPGADDVITYKFRYRYASTTEHGTNAQIQFTFPTAYEIVAPALLGGNISNVSNVGNQYTISLESPASLGLPSGTLAAGSSGLFEFQVKFKCGTNGSGGIPSAGSSVNLTQNPIFTVTGVSNTASAPSNVTVPTVSSCTSTTPTSSGSNEFYKRSFSGFGQGRRALFGLYVPTNETTVYTYTDIFPQGFKIYGGLEGTLSPGWTLEVQANGAWWDISSYQNVENFIHNVAIGATLKDQNGTDITGTSRVSTFVPDGTNPPAGTSYAEGVTGIRVTGSGYHGGYFLRMYIEPNAPLGWTQNCLTTNNPAYSTDCVDIFVDNRGSLKSFCFFQGSPQSLGGTALSDRGGVGINVSTAYPNLYKDPMDAQGNIVIDQTVDLTPIDAPTIEILLPLGFDFVEGTTKPNYWFVNNVGGNIHSNPPAAFNPIFTRTPDYNGTGRVLLKWDFPLLTFPVGRPANAIPRLALVFSSRYMGTHPLPPSHAYFDVTITAQSVFTNEQGLPTQSITCNPHVGIPSSGGSVNSEKYVRGALDVQQSRYPISGNTELSGDATYELYVYNHNFQRLKEIDIADILPYIGDKDMLGTSSRGSGWSEELTNAITVERYKIGTGLVDASSEIPNGVLYSNTYNACYLDGALPSGQVTANPASASVGQSGGCTDFSSSVAPAGAKGFAFRWIDNAEPLEFGEYLKITVDVTQLNGEADMTNNEVAWNSFAYTVTEEDDDVLFSSEPLKVGVKMIDMNNYAAIGGRVWHDENGNGKQDGGEESFKDITVSLYDGSGNPITETATINGVSTTTNVTTLTDSLGNYRFYGLQPSTTYAVRLENDNNFVGNGTLTGFYLTLSNASGILDTEDSDALEGTLSGSPSTPRPQIGILMSDPNGSIQIYNDFGFYKPASLGNYVWLDDNADGSQNTDENPVQGVEMTLKRENGTVVGTTTTNSNGLYFFENLIPGNYYVEVTNGIPAGRIPTNKQVSGNDETDSDFNTTPNIQTDILALASGQVRGDIDLGLKNQVLNPAAICGTAWDDLDEDGVQDSGEPGQAYMTVNLLDANDFVLNSLQTDANGDYCFYNLPPNTGYKVAFVLPSVTASSYTNPGADMDANTSTGITGTYTPTNNQTINDIDCGIIGPFSIGNLVWLDANNNGQKDASESPYSNVEVFLLNSTGTTILAQTTTDNSGRYLFKNLTQGTYRVEIELPIYSKSSNDPTNAATPNATDNDDNGIGTATSGRIQSQPITLQQGGGSNTGANWTETDHGELINGENDPASNPKAYYTVDFGVVALPPPTSCSTGPDSDSDGILDICDLDDDNDGILDSDECPQSVGSGLSGHLTGFTYSISSTNPSSSDVPHVLNSITYGGTTYTDFILPDGFQSFYSLTNNSGARFTENGVPGVFDYNSPTYDQDILVSAYQNRNLNAYQDLGSNNYADGDYYELSYNIPVLSTAGGFVAITERNGNNGQVIQALDAGGNVIGPTLTIQPSHYVDLGHNILYYGNTQNVYMALYPIEDLAPLGSSIYGLRISFGASATTDGPDAKVFFFGDLALVQCDYDGDGIPNDLDLDSDDDGCPDAIEGTASFTNSNLQNDRLTGGIDSDGVPTVANGGQGAGASYDEFDNSACNEICNNGTDEDGDGLIDCQDPDCPCHYACSVPACPNVMVIDSFNNYSTAGVDPTNNVADSTESIGGICGSRGLYVAFESGYNYLITGVGSTTTLSISESAASNAEYYITYDGTGGNGSNIPDATVGLGGLDFTNRTFQLRFDSGDFNSSPTDTRSITVNLNIWSSPTNLSSATVLLDKDTPDGTTITFSSITPILGGGADLTAVTALQLHFNTSGNAIDATFSNFNAVCLNEICDNGIDDDGDGLIDCADGDCIIPKPNSIITD